MKMGFGNFLLKAANFAGKAIVAVASEVMSQGTTTITKNYLEQAQKLNLTSSQRSLVKDAETINNRLAEQKRYQKNISDDIKNNKEKIIELNMLLDDKAYQIWVVVSKLIPDGEFYKVSSYKNKKSLSFLGDVKTNILLTDFANGLLSLDDVDFNSYMLDYLNGIIPNCPIKNLPDGFFDELNPIVNEYRIVFEKNSKEIDFLSKENITLEDKFIDAKEKTSEINGKLKPLLDEIKEFCRPMLEELKERNSRR